MEFMMKTCKNCKINIDADICPLCHGATQDSDDKTSTLTGFPKSKKIKLNF